MAQPFECFCGSAGCRDKIAGAKDMSPKQLEGLWLNGHIRELKEEQQGWGQAGAVGHAVEKNDHRGNVLPAGVGASPPSTGSLTAAATRRGPTSRELSGEMGGDTLVA